jgi:hypothetical protein
MQDGVTLSRSKSVDGHKSATKLYLNYVIVIQNLTFCQNYKCFFFFFQNGSGALSGTL